MDSPIKQSAQLISHAAQLVKQPCVFTDEDIEEARQSMESLVDAWQALVTQIEETTAH